MEALTKSAPEPSWTAPYAKIRADCYVVLASLLGQLPSENLLKVLQNLQWEESIPEGIDRALGDLRQAGGKYSLGALEEEYGKLFVGLGSGEIVPYASWYREKKMQAAPLALLRSDLVRLGIVRQAENREPEDHAGALCECMALLCQSPKERDRATQAGFFQRHVAPWMTTFFKDLESAKSARFYRIVGLFGRRFLETESEYLE